MAKRIDAFSHLFPKSFLDELGRRYPDRMVDVPQAPRFWNVDERIPRLDAAGVDEQVVMLGRPGLWEAVPEADRLSLVRFANDELVSTTEAYSDRLHPVVTLPELHSDYVDELERCLDDLGAVGVQVFSNVLGRPIDDPAHREFFVTVERRDVPVWIHPHMTDYHDWSGEFVLNKIFGWPFDTSLALARLVFSGTLDRHPGLKIVTHHMGGMVPYYAERIQDFYDAYPSADWNDLSKPLSEYFRMFYADTVSNGALGPLRLALDFYGPDHLVFALDYPFGPEAGEKWLREIPAAVESLDLTDEQWQNVVGGTIARLIK